MLLTVNNEVPSWWIDERTSTLGAWWDGLSWQDYPVPDKLSCNGIFNPVTDLICRWDQANHTVTEFFGHEWLYKMLANAGSVVRKGFELEIEKIVELVSGVIIWI